ncbi:tetratricopeptide repeat protein [Pedobacter nototheniae]|uniref:tetratricopeptide repeat protein n=1 Tax=Pedobacter nototheniae TaxID=2488994 RepID=UPI00104028D9|nr:MULTISPECIES: tetratricopeptide repeat protein [Pedobacter]
MSNKVPVTSQIAWSALIIQFVIIFLLYYTFQYLAFVEPLISAAVAYAMLAFILRKTIASNHRKGIVLIKQRQFLQSIPYFEKSIASLEQHSWIDKYRFITLFSSSKLSYKEMDLCNIAFAYSQIGDGENAIIYYEKAMALNSNNGLAIAGLNMLNATKQK